MPFTPLHMGPGIVIKVCLQGTFSLMVFGWSQILMDIQPLLVMLSGEGELHGFSHTLVGATLIAILALLSGKHLAEFGLRFLRLAGYNPIRWRVAVISAFIGTYSHVLIDSIMHSDVLPLAPFSKASPLYGIVTIEILHLLCIATAVVGGLVYVLLRRLRRTLTEFR